MKRNTIRTAKAINTEAAQKMKRAQQLFIAEQITRAEFDSIMETLKEEQFFTAETFRYDAARIGDLVTQEVVDNAMNILPPACMRSDCSQMGEPYSHRIDPDTGKWRAVYATFKVVGIAGSDILWQYCGHCFRGENIERGEEPTYTF